MTKEIFLVKEVFCAVIAVIIALTLFSCTKDDGGTLTGTKSIVILYDNDVHGAINGYENNCQRSTKEQQVPTSVRHNIHH